MSRRASGPRPAALALATPSCGVTDGGCELGDTLRLLSRAHVLDLVDVLARSEDPMGFASLRRVLRVNANILSQRLIDLQGAGLVTRSEEGGYTATGMGRALLPALGPLREWALLHRPPPIAETSERATRGESARSISGVSQT